MTSDQRLLLCRPASGLADTLCQIDLARQHGERFARKVIVETDYAVATKFRDALSNYFVSADPDLVLDAAPYRSLFDTLPVAPSHIFGRVCGYLADWDPSIRAYVDAESRRSLKPDLSVDYAEPLLVYHCTGNTRRAPAALARMRLQPVLVDALFRRLGAIGEPYTAIHIRNTDFRTGYHPVIERLSKVIEGPVFLATDDIGALDFTRSVFGESRIFSFANLPASPDRPLHNLGPTDNAYERNSDAIVDLMLLALSRQLWILPLQQNVYGSRYSGYSILAKQLQDSPQTLRGLLSLPADQPAAP